MEHQFTKLQGQYLAFFVAYSKLNRRPPAEADFQRYFDVTPPSVHNMVVTLERRGLIIDVLVVVADDADLAPLATCSRRLQGHAQSVNRGADVFLADERGTYIGRTCRWKECRPGIRRSCHALHCGRRAHLHDDLEAIRLNGTLVLSPPVTLWPHVERRGQLPPDVEELVAALEHAV